MYESRPNKRGMEASRKRGWPQDLHSLQVQACAWLGHWYREVAGDLEKAKNCYEQTLLLDASDRVTANLLKQVNEQLGLLKDQAAGGGNAASGSLLKPSAFEATSKQAFDEKIPTCEP